jgi:hypothetical protein
LASEEVGVSKTLFQYLIITMIDILYNLLQDPDAYWVLYDLLLEHEWADVNINNLTIEWFQLGAGSYCGQRAVTVCGYRNYSYAGDPSKDSTCDEESMSYSNLERYSMTLNEDH